MRAEYRPACGFSLRRPGLRIKSPPRKSPSIKGPARSEEGLILVLLRCQTRTIKKLNCHRRMNPYKENRLLWGCLDEIHDVIVAGVEELKRVTAERDQARRQGDSLRQENKVFSQVTAERDQALRKGHEVLCQVTTERDQAKGESSTLRQENEVLWEEVVAQQQLIIAQQKLIEEMRRVRAARARYGA